MQGAVARANREECSAAVQGVVARANREDRSSAVVYTVQGAVARDNMRRVHSSRADEFSLRNWRPYFQFQRELNCYHITPAKTSKYTVSYGGNLCYTVYVFT